MSGWSTAGRVAEVVVSECVVERLILLLGKFLFFRLVAILAAVLRVDKEARDLTAFCSVGESGGRRGLVSCFLLLVLLVFFFLIHSACTHLCYSPLVLTSFEDQLSILLVVSRVVLFRFRRSLGWCRRHAPLAIAHRHHLFSNQSGSRQTQQLFGE